MFFVAFLYWVANGIAMFYFFLWGRPFLPLSQLYKVKTIMPGCQRLVLAMKVLTALYFLSRVTFKTVLSLVNVSTTHIVVESALI